jgi:hypothetical protein
MGVGFIDCGGGKTVSTDGSDQQSKLNTSPCLPRKIGDIWTATYGKHGKTIEKLQLIYTFSFPFSIRRCVEKRYQ